jgi:mRNA-degrading endonuclease RelE of RelBE toxin-antitoxin system
MYAIGAYLAYVDKPQVPMTVQETPEFAKEAERLLGKLHTLNWSRSWGSIQLRESSCRTTGGVRKLGWAVPGRGKRGGARVIYYFLDESAPLLALDIYAKTVQEDLAEEQKRQLRMVASAYAKRHGR